MTLLFDERVIARIKEISDGAEVVAVSIVGSVARGEATRWSDIDVQRVVAAGQPRPPTAVHWIDGRLVLVETVTLDHLQDQLKAPETANWAAPAIRDMHVLIDKTGAIAELKSRAARFAWKDLGDAPAKVVRIILTKATEYVLKIRSAIERGDESAALHAAGALMSRCTRALTTARGVMIRSENEYYARAREAGGPEWTRLHRAAFGLPSGDAFAQATASCQLYAETVRLLDDLLDEDTRRLTAPALEAIPSTEIPREDV